ncbi:MAG: ABC transporter permease [Flavobacteriales bacterium]|nr:ABC transporter permease [Flavobacteriales bacterium]
MTKVTVYTPEALLLSPRRLWKDMRADLAASTGLARALALRDIRSQYRASILGYFWAFLTPLFSTAVWVFLSYAGVIRVAETDIPYPVYVFSGTMLWQIFTEALSSPLAQIIASKGMLSKLNFPREALILSGFYKVLFSALIKVAILVPTVVLFGVTPDLGLILFPVAVIVLIITGISVGLLLAPLGTLYSDIGRFIPMVTQMLMYLTPVVFAMPTAGVLARIFSANPMTPLVLTARAWLTGGEALMLPYFWSVGAAVLVLLVIALLWYRITMPVLIERISS